MYKQIGACLMVSRAGNNCVVLCRANTQMNKTVKNGPTAILKSDKNQDTSLCHLQETGARYKDTKRLKVKGQKTFHANGIKRVLGGKQV
jgi:hypothetical protein